MNGRQRHALTRPLDTTGVDLAPYRTTRTHATGVLLMTILAVDR